MKKILFLLLIVLLQISIFSQEFGIGTLLDEDLYINSPTAAPLMRGDYSDLPPSASLKNYTPTPGNQGSFSTCAGWSSAYGGRTILEAIGRNWNQDSINENAFSPSFVYNQIRTSNECNRGTSLLDALDVLKLQGGEKLKDFAYDCSRTVTNEDKLRAAKHRIIEYREVATSKTEHKERFVRKSISENRPVVIAFDCPYSFNYVKELWLPDSSDYKMWNRGHAMTIIGYDDNKFGGSFEILNSWGTNWGNNGFVWIRYEDFDFFCKYAFELIDKSLADPNAPDLSGSLTFKDASGNLMKSDFNGNYFVMENPYQSGTLFELHISNDEPAYVYAFSSDLTNKTYKIFPFTERMVAYLPYKNNNIAIPDEQSYNMLDNVSGTSYFCFLYSKEKLDIDNIITQTENETGTFWEKINKVLKNKLIDGTNIEYKSDDKIFFSAKSKLKSVVPVLVEIKHL